MTDAAERKFPDNDADNGGISADDPLFELSRLMAFDQDAAPQEPQMNLEDALLAELKQSEPQAAPVETDELPAMDVAHEESADALFDEADLPALDHSDAFDAAADAAPIEDFLPTFEDEPVEELVDEVASPMDDVETDHTDLLMPVEDYAVEAHEDALAEGMADEDMLARYMAEEVERNQLDVEHHAPAFADDVAEQSVDLPEDVDAFAQVLEAETVSDEMDQFAETLHEDFPQDEAMVLSADGHDGALSLEDELAMMLGDAPAEPEAFAVDTVADEGVEEEVEDMPLASQQWFRPVLSDAADEDVGAAMDDDAFDAAVEPMDVAAVETFDDALEAPVEPLEAVAIDIFDGELEDAFEAFAAEEIEPVVMDEPAIEEPVTEEPVNAEMLADDAADEAAMALDDALDAEFSGFFEGEFEESSGAFDDLDAADSAPAPVEIPAMEALAAAVADMAPKEDARLLQQVEAPTLDVVEMSGFDAPEPEVVVPDLPDIGVTLENALEDELTLDASDFADTADDGSSLWAAGAPLAAGAAVAGAMAARVTPPTLASDHGDDFDEVKFEAELARDLEFVRHDLAAREAEDDFVIGDDGLAPVAVAQRPQRRGMMVAAVLGLVAIVGAAGLFAMSGGTETDDGAPVLVKADPEPMKVAPENPGGAEVPNQDRAVFDTAATNGETSQETLNSTTEEPVDIAAVPSGVTPTDVESAIKDDERLLPDVEGLASQDDPASVTPRRVRTLVVKPDGTLVERELTQEQAIAEAAPAGGPPAPVVAVDPAANAEVAVAAVPEAATPEVVAEAPVEAAPADTAAATAPVTEVAAAEAAPAARPVPQAVPTRKVATQRIVAPLIADRPADQPVNVVGAAGNRTNPETRVEQAAAQPAAAPEPVAVTTAPSSGGYVVQIAALPSEGEAKQSAANLSRKYGGLISGRGMNIQKAVVQGKGTFYRVRVAASDRADATSLCERIKANGGGCFVTR